ncbi:MAG TPA: AIM24 family protein, partial [Candidatus Thalassarchaeaceae archaeon]
MQNHIEFDPEFALLTVSVNPGETIRAESGAMVSMAGVEMETKS